MENSGIFRRNPRVKRRKEGETTMASSKDILEMNEHGNLSRRPLFKVLGATGFGWLFGKLMAREVHAKVGNAYPRVMPSVKTSFNHHSV